jgi:hypothetical protein
MAEPLVKLSVPSGQGAYGIFMMIVEIIFMLYHNKHVTYQGGWTK